MRSDLEIKQDILADNKKDAAGIRARLAECGTYMVNVMASPGSGKTTTILALIEALREGMSFAVIEGDLESFVDSEKVKAAGVPAVQIQTAGACHLDGPMMNRALRLLNLEELDCVFVENIGNLVCPAEFDLGADLDLMILSVPEGHDKITKYPPMFGSCDVLVINKAAYLELPGNDFDLDYVRVRMAEMNPEAPIFVVDSKSGQGLEALAGWLKNRVEAKIG